MLVVQIAGQALARQARTRDGWRTCLDSLSLEVDNAKLPGNYRPDLPPRDRKALNILQASCS